MTAYYNEVDKHAARWLHQLIAAGLIPDGHVDERSIADVRPEDVEGYTQCHFFAGIGGWAYAARLAGWPDDRPLWTGSCPCQPFSVAGQRGGAADRRHLWPDFFRLIRAARPACVFGEQVAGALGYRWLDGVQSDLAAASYASRAFDIPACAVDAPQIRSRLYWVAVADAEGECGQGKRFGRAGAGRRQLPSGGYDAERGVRMANADIIGRARCADPGAAAGPTREGSASTGWRATGVLEPQRLHGGDGGSGVDSAQGVRPSSRHAEPMEGRGEHERTALQFKRSDHSRGGRNGTFWSDAEWLVCHDGKARRTQSRIPLLVDGLPGRVAAWRGLGNAIVPILAAEVIGAFLDTEG